MYIYLRVCIYVNMYNYVYIHIYVYICIYTYIYIYTRICIERETCMCMDVHMYAYVEYMYRLCIAYMCIINNLEEEKNYSETYLERSKYLTTAIVQLV